MEGGGTLSQDHVRGAIYRDLFASRGIVAHYVGNTCAPPAFLLRPSSKFFQGLVKTYEYRLFWEVITRICRFYNQRKIIILSRRYDAIVLVKVNSLPLVKKLRKHSKARIVYDLSDAVWLPFHGGSYPHIKEILRTVHAVTWDYRYTLEFARQYNGEVFHWPAPSQVELFDLKRNRKDTTDAGGKIILGWVGSHGTAYNLYAIWEALEGIFKKHPDIHLRLVGTGTDPLLLPHFENVSYSALPFYDTQQMIDEILNMDIGLFPLFDVEDSRIRGFLKALVYMSGETVVASPRGQIPELIQDGINGMLADSSSEWVEKLDLLINDAVLRKRIAAGGLETARRDFSLEKSFEGLLDALKLDAN
jgi:glycosyltransferase involved in cell wall biosynthesis